eukprot:9523774-Lingulodinium_polyedra.AAC.1
MQSRLGILPPVNFHRGIHIYKPDNRSPTEDSSCFTFMSWNPGALTLSRLDVNRQARRQNR